MWEEHAKKYANKAGWYRSEGEYISRSVQLC